MSACRSTSGRFKRCGARAARPRVTGHRAVFALPKAETIAAGFGISEARGKTVRKAMAAVLTEANTRGIVGDRGWGIALLEAASKALDPFGSPSNRYGFRGTYGVEAIGRESSRYGALYYVNTGDTYSPTIAFYPATGRIRVVPGGWAAAAGLG